jgi:hypothetical protein
MRFPWDREQVDRIADLDECLEDLKEDMDPSSLEYYTDCINVHLRHDESVSERLFKLIEDSFYPSCNRWAAIESLTTFFIERKDNAQMEKLADSLMSGIRKYHEEDRSLDGYVDGGTIAFRILSIPQEKRGATADLMRMQITRIKDHYGLHDNGNKNIFGDSLLVLGSYGDARDIPLILDFIEEDKNTLGEYIDPAQKVMTLRNGRITFVDSPLVITNNRFMFHTLEGLRRLLIRNADKVDEGKSKEVRRVCGDLLEESVIPTDDQDSFNCSALTLKTLSSRLEPADLDLGARYSELSNELRSGSALVRVMLNSIKDNKKDLAIVGQERWLHEKEPYADKVCKRLSGIIANN